MRKGRVPQRQSLQSSRNERERQNWLEKQVARKEEEPKRTPLKSVANSMSQETPKEGQEAPSKKTQKRIFKKWSDEDSESPLKAKVDQENKENKENEVFHNARKSKLANQVETQAKKQKDAEVPREALGIWVETRKPKKKHLIHNKEFVWIPKKDETQSLSSEKTIDLSNESFPSFGKDPKESGTMKKPRNSCIHTSERKSGELLGEGGNSDSKKSSSLFASSFATPQVNDKKYDGKLETTQKLEKEPHKNEAESPPAAQEERSSPDPLCLMLKEARALEAQEPNEQSAKRREGASQPAGVSPMKFVQMNPEAEQVQEINEEFDKKREEQEPAGVSPVKPQKMRLNAIESLECLPELLPGLQDSKLRETPVQMKPEEIKPFELEAPNELQAVSLDQIEQSEKPKETPEFLLIQTLNLKSPLMLGQSIDFCSSLDLYACLTSPGVLSMRSLSSLSRPLFLNYKEHYQNVISCSLKQRPEDLFHDSHPMDSLPLIPGYSEVPRDLRYAVCNLHDSVKFSPNGRAIGVSSNIYSGMVFLVETSRGLIEKFYINPTKHHALCCTWLNDIWFAVAYEDGTISAFSIYGQVSEVAPATGYAITSMELDQNGILFTLDESNVVSCYIPIASQCLGFFSKLDYVRYILTWNISVAEEGACNAHFHCGMKRSHSMRFLAVTGDCSQTVSVYEFPKRDYNGTHAPEKKWTVKLDSPTLNVEWTPGDEYLVVLGSGSPDKLILLRASDGQKVTEFSEFDGQVNWMAMHPKTPQVFAGCQSGKLKMVSIGQETRSSC